MAISEAFMVALSGMLVVMAELGLLAGIIVIMSKIIRAMVGDKAGSAAAKSAPPSVSCPAPAPAAAVLPETQSSGSLDLHGVDDRTAAILMAIVSDESGIALNELYFQSIRALD